MALVTSAMTSATTINPTTVNTPATAPVLEKNEFEDEAAVDAGILVTVGV
jgi:hypothetical protein